MEKQRNENTESPEKLLWMEILHAMLWGWAAAYAFYYWVGPYAGATFGTAVTGIGLMGVVTAVGLRHRATGSERALPLARLAVGTCALAGAALLGPIQAAAGGTPFPLGNLLGAGITAVPFWALLTLCSGGEPARGNRGTGTAE